MDERCLKWLHDIKMALIEIEDYFKDREKNFLEYQQNTMLKRAIERNLEIIGEAMNRILKRDNEIGEKITSAKAIIGLRNQVIHAYDSISDENIWSVVITHLPILKAEIVGILNQK